MKHLIEYTAAPTADKFREVDAAELGEIIREIRVAEASASAAGGVYYDDWQVDIGAATRAAELMDAFGERIFVARDEDGFYFAHEPRKVSEVKARGEEHL